MSKKFLANLILIFMASTCFSASLITNGSFEADGYVGEISSQSPTDWDVNIPSNFDGELGNAWSTDGDYALTLYSAFGSDFISGQRGVISQLVDLTDANEIIFDLNLEAMFGSWDGSKFTVFISLDNEQNYIWQSAVDADGIYYDINVLFGDDITGIHTIYVGLRADISGTISNSFWASLDYIKLDAYCGGFGYLESDFNRDCYVDFEDIEILAANWLRTDLTASDDLINLTSDNSINLSDFAFLALQWANCTDWQNPDCLEVPLELSADLNLDGIVNIADYSILVSKWLTSDTSFDLDGSGTVDYKDLAIMQSQWLLKSWLYKYK